MNYTEVGIGLHSQTSRIQPGAPINGFKILEMVVFLLNQRWLAVVYVPLGLFGNITSVFITTKKQNRSISACVYMSALAILDSFALFATFLYIMFFAGHGIGDSISGSPRKVLLLGLLYLAYSFAMASGLCLALMSLDRAIATVLPLRATTICTASRAKKASVVAFLVPSLPNTNVFFTYQVLKDEATGLDTVIMNFPEPYWVENVISAYFLAIGTIIPFVVIMACNIIIIAHVKHAARTRGAMTTGSKAEVTLDERRLTRMLILVSMAYVILSIPLRLYETLMTVPAVSNEYDMEQPYWQLRYRLQYWVFADLWNMNFAVNFYLYVLGGGKKFRNEAKQVYLCCIKD